ncbi:unnamed protein product [Arctogadus glacialis]
MRSWGAWPHHDPEHSVRPLTEGGCVVYSRSVPSPRLGAADISRTKGGLLWGDDITPLFGVSAGLLLSARPYGPRGLEARPSAPGASGPVPLPQGPRGPSLCPRSLGARPSAPGASGPVPLPQEPRGPSLCPRGLGARPSAPGASGTRYSYSHRSLAAVLQPRVRRPSAPKELGLSLWSRGLGPAMVQGPVEGHVRSSLESRRKQQRGEMARHVGFDRAHKTGRLKKGVKLQSDLRDVFFWRQNSRSSASIVFMDRSVPNTLCVFSVDTTSEDDLDTAFMFLQQLHPSD